MLLHVPLYRTSYGKYRSNKHYLEYDIEKRIRPRALCREIQSLVVRFCKRAAEHFGIAWVKHRKTSEHNAVCLVLYSLFALALLKCCKGIVFAVINVCLPLHLSHHRIVLARPVERKEVGYGYLLVYKVIVIAQHTRVYVIEYSVVCQYVEGYVLILGHLRKSAARLRHKVAVTHLFLGSIEIEIASAEQHRKVDCKTQIVEVGAF